MEKITKLVNNHKEIIKYLIAGITSAFINISLLFIFTEILKLWYLISSTIAFFFAFCASFGLQKFWTFKDGSLRQIKRQTIMYFSVASMNLVINLGIIYVLVDIVQIWYIYAQIMISSTLAISSFLIYKFKIFNQGLLSLKNLIPWHDR
ncbi:GtrA family protein [Patescibacteria group bacterium]|nr:GtrA family protein [Patescibacteria group bacterium]